MYGQHPADLSGPGGGLKCPEVTEHFSVLLVKHMQTFSIAAVNILVGTVLLHHKDGGTGFQNFMLFRLGHP